MRISTKLQSRNIVGPRQWLTNSEIERTSCRYIKVTGAVQCFRVTKQIVLILSIQGGPQEGKQRTTTSVLLKWLKRGQLQPQLEFGISKAKTGSSSKDYQA
ncbi:hypothetical protein GBA52_016009 [Prunus armeniaca]|nr:hypothetical protein GBA52_016009 [Prunus armeniaca]